MAIMAGCPALRGLVLSGILWPRLFGKDNKIHKYLLHSIIEYAMYVPTTYLKVSRDYVGILRSYAATNNLRV